MSGVPGARWQDDAQLHLTLRFIGEVDRHRANDIADALSKVALTPSDIAVDGVGLFERKGRVDSLWAGVQPQAPLARLHRKIDRIWVQAGLTPESRAYLPHITLARFGRRGARVDSFLARNAALSSPPFSVTGFSLYESHLGHGGSTYREVATY